MATPRIVSLLPSATEIVCALGADRFLIGRSHACDHPATLADVPVMTASKVNGAAASGAIASDVRSILAAALSVYELQLEALRDTTPDLILTQTCLLYTSPSPRDLSTSRMPSSA